MATRKFEAPTGDRPVADPKKLEQDQWIEGLFVPGWTVYWLMDEAGEILYVGKTKDLERRLREHHLRCPWVRDTVRNIRAATGLRRDEAAIRERDAIAELRPPYNRSGKDRW